MPLIHGSSRADVSSNIREMISSGHPRKSAVAAALRTADQYAKRAAGGSAGAPQVPTYKTADSGILPSGLMPTPQVGGYSLDQNGALSPQTQQLLQSFAMRGLAPPPSPVAAPVTATPSGPPPPPPDASTTNNSGARRGGRLANGGAPPSTPWFTRSEAHSMDHMPSIHPSGLVHGMGPGRTDTVPLSVAAGSHVIPADVVAGLGQGNTLAGAHALGMAMKEGPGGISLPSGPHRATIPRVPHLANGGEPQFEGHAIKLAKGGVPGGVKCIVAGGEWIMSPDEVQRVKHAGKASHEAIDHWILERRKADVKKLKSLPGPVK